MSEEQARKKQEEIETFEKREAQDFVAMYNEKCPVCGLLFRELQYVNVQVLQMFGWVECTRCGNVYAPEFTRKAKIKMGMSNMVVPGSGQIITPQ